MNTRRMIALSKTLDKAMQQMERLEPDEMIVFQRRWRTAGEKNSPVRAINNLWNSTQNTIPSKAVAK